jgi:DNA-binding response OmpR family regulator
VLVAGDGLSALNLFHEEQPSAVILDLIVPKISGRELCRTFKSIANNTAVVILSAIDEVYEKVLLFELGADDYITKPFSPRELTARVEAAVRRQRKPETATSYRFSSWEIDFLRMKVQREGSPVELTTYEFKLLKFFVENAEQVLSRDLLLNRVWGYSGIRTTRVVDNQILKLRQKLESDRSNPRHLLTIRGAGYKFVP